MRDLRQTLHWANYMEAIGWEVKDIDGVRVYLKKIPILGWYAKIQRSKNVSEKMINKIEREYRPFQIIIEPSTKMINLDGFKISKTPSLPTKTLQVDLTKSENSLLKSFSQKTRYNVKLYQKKQISIETGGILEFTRFWRNNFEKSRFPLPFFSQVKSINSLYRVFGSDSMVLLAKKNGKIISGLFVIISPPLAYYMYAVSNDMGRKNFAPTLLTWRAMMESKKRHCTTFDFDGIYDERFPIESWKGFSKFKKGFGGKEVEYPGCYVKRKNKISII